MLRNYSSPSVGVEREMKKLEKFNDSEMKSKEGNENDNKPDEPTTI